MRRGKEEQEKKDNLLHLFFFLSFFLFFFFFFFLFFFFFFIFIFIFFFWWKTSYQLRSMLSSLVRPQGKRMLLSAEQARRPSEEEGWSSFVPGRYDAKQSLVCCASSSPNRRRFVLHASVFYTIVMVNIISSVFSSGWLWLVEIFTQVDDLAVPGAGLRHLDFPVDVQSMLEGLFVPPNAQQQVPVHSTPAHPPPVPPAEPPRVRLYGNEQDMWVTYDYPRIYFLYLFYLDYNHH